MDIKIDHRGKFGELLRILNFTGNGMEIGVEKGKFSKVILNSNLSKVYLLDAWMKFSPEESRGMIDIEQSDQDKNYDIVVKNSKPYGDRVVIIRKRSDEAINDFEDGFFDFIYIDANHDYEHVKQDLSLWYPKVKNCGIFAGHDYVNVKTSSAIFGVKQAVDEFCVENRINDLFVTNERHNKSWYLLKR